MVKKIYQSKTVWAGIGTVVTGIGLMISGEADLQEFIMSVMGVVFIVLRIVTNKPIE